LRSLGPRAAIGALAASAAFAAAAAPAGARTAVVSPQPVTPHAVTPQVVSPPPSPAPVESAPPAASVPPAAQSVAPPAAAVPTAATAPGGGPAPSPSGPRPPASGPLAIGQCVLVCREEREEAVAIWSFNNPDQARAWIERLAEVADLDMARYALPFLLNEFDGTNSLPTVTLGTPTITLLPAATGGSQPASGGGQPGGEAEAEPDAISGGRLDEQAPGENGQGWAELFDGGGTFCSTFNERQVDGSRPLGSCD